MTTERQIRDRMFCKFTMEWHMNLLPIVFGYSVICYTSVAIVISMTDYSQSKSNVILTVLSAQYYDVFIDVEITFHFLIAT